MEAHLSPKPVARWRYNQLEAKLEEMHDLLRALKRWHHDVEEGTVCHWCKTDLHEDESEIPHTEDCPWRWILDACREAGVE